MFISRYMTRSGIAGSYIKKQRYCFANKGPSSQGYGFSSGHLWMWELDCEESWTLKNWCFWTVVLEKTLESPLDCKEIQPVHFKGDQSWVFFGRNDAKAETPILWLPHAKSWLIGKDLGPRRDLGQEEKGMTEDEIAGWHHWLNGREFEWTLGVGDGQGGLACCSSWACKESDMTERLNWTEGPVAVLSYWFSCVRLCMLKQSFSSVRFSRLVVSDPLRPHKLQHARPLYPSPTPGVHPNPCPLSRWFYPTILSSVIPFSSCPKSQFINKLII